jgi:hypothetical protein
MVTTTHLFVAVPLLRAIENLPETITVDGMRCRFTGEVTSAPIIRGFFAHRAYFECDRGSGHVDLSSVSSWRCEMVLHVQGLRPARAERLLLGLRTALVADTTIPDAGTSDDRIDACQTA